MTKDKIIIKEAVDGLPYKAPDEKILDPTEKLHYKLFDTQYRLSDPKFPAWRRIYIDSLLKVYPYLFDPAYYLKLTHKLFSITQPFEYSKKEIEISSSKFNKIVNIINNSGYWKRPYYNEDCNLMDGEGIFFEAITKQKYKSIYFTLCPDDSSELRNAYNEVLKYAGVEDGKLGRRDTIAVSQMKKLK